MKTSMFLAAIATVGLALPSASAQPRGKGEAKAGLEGGVDVGGAVKVKVGGKGKAKAAEAEASAGTEAEAQAQGKPEAQGQPGAAGKAKAHGKAEAGGEAHAQGNAAAAGEAHAQGNAAAAGKTDAPGLGIWARLQSELLISSYTPRTGKAGAKITVHGKNFAPGTVVLVGDTQVEPTKITPTRLTFQLPKDVSGEVGLRLQVPDSRRLYVLGGFEIADAKPAAERKKQAAERKREAQKRWKERIAKLSKKEKERRERLAELEAELEASREQRRQERQAELRERFEATILADEQTQAELALHARRLARIERMRRLAEVKANGKLGVRIEIVLDKENQRHERRMAALQTALSANTEAGMNNQ